jgi:hypothetical protein
MVSKTELEKAGFVTIQRTHIYGKWGQIYNKGIPCWRFKPKTETSQGYVYIYHVFKNEAGAMFLAHPKLGLVFYPTNTEGEDVYRIRTNGVVSAVSGVSSILSKVDEMKLDPNKMYELKQNEAFGVWALTSKTVN